MDAKNKKGYVKEPSGEFDSAEHNPFIERLVEPGVVAFYPWSAEADRVIRLKGWPRKLDPTENVEYQRLDEELRKDWYGGKQIVLRLGGKEHGSDDFRKDNASLLGADLAHRTNRVLYGAFEEAETRRPFDVMVVSKLFADKGKPYHMFNGIDLIGDDGTIVLAQAKGVATLSKRAYLEMLKDAFPELEYSTSLTGDDVYEFLEQQRPAA